MKTRKKDSEVAKIQTKNASEWYAIRRQWAKISYPHRILEWMRKKVR